MMNNDITKYLKDCKKVFPFIGDKEKEFLKRFQDSVESHLVENENLTYEDLVKQMGLPKDVMISYIQDCDNEYIINKMNTKKVLKRVSIIVCTLLIIGLSIISVLELITIQKVQEQKIITEEVIIEQD